MATKENNKTFFNLDLFKKILFKTLDKSKTTQTVTMAKAISE